MHKRNYFDVFYDLDNPMSSSESIEPRRDPGPLFVYGRAGTDPSVDPHRLPDTFGLDLYTDPGEADRLDATHPYLELSDEMHPAEAEMPLFAYSEGELNDEGTVPLALVNHPQDWDMMDHENAGDPRWSFHWHSKPANKSNLGRNRLQIEWDRMHGVVDSAKHELRDWWYPENPHAVQHPIKNGPLKRLVDERRESSSPQLSSSDLFE